MDSAEVLQKFLKLVAAQIAVAKNFGEQPRSYGFAGVNRNDSRTPIAMLQEMMTALDAQHLKTGLLQDR